MSVMADVIDPLAAKNVLNASSRFGGGLESLEGLGLKNLDNVRANQGSGNDKQLKQRLILNQLTMRQPVLMQRTQQQIQVH